MGHRRHWPLSLFLLIEIISILMPLFILIVWSLSGRWPWPDLAPEALSLRGIQSLLGGRFDILQVMFSSTGFSLVVAVLATIIGTMAARAIVFYDFRGKKLISFGSILPIIVPGTVLGMGIHVVFIYLGLSDTYLGVLLVHLICALPYTVAIMADITRAVGNKLEIQAQVLGVPVGKAFSHVTLPQLLPGILSSLSMAYIISFSQYFLTLLIGGGSVKTLAVVMVPLIYGGDRTIASAYALLFTLSSLIVFGLFELAGKKMK
jgi:putative spermidine/putrescine transport system permease protein